MSERAEIDRSMRRLWAATGSRHDRVIRWLRLGLPAVIGVVSAILVFSPFARRSEVSFLLSKDNVEVAGERMRVTRAVYRGQDGKGQPFALVAGSAVQKSSAEPVVKLTKLSAAIRLHDGPATIASDMGRYNMSSETVAIPGAVTVNSAGGYHLVASGVEIDLKQRKLRGNDGVNGSLNLGQFSANSLVADLDAQVVRLQGNARLRINQGVL